MSLFGAQAGSLLFGIPFAAGAAIVLAAIAVIAAFGYQWIHQVEGWFAPVMIVLFGYLTYRILRHHITLPVQTAHGAALAGAVLLMLAIVLSGSLSWCPYAADFARRLPEGTSSRRVFGFAAAGTLAAGIWSALLGLAAATVIGGNQTAAGIRAEAGGGAAGDAALVTIMLAAILSCCMNAYSSSLAFQAAGLPVKRPWLTTGISGAALGLVVWMQTGSVSGHFENVLLLADYWVAPFVAVVMINWLRRHQQYTATELVQTLPLKRLPGRLVGLGRVRPRVRRDDPLHEHEPVPGPGVGRTAQRRHRIPGRIRRHRGDLPDAAATVPSIASRNSRRPGHGAGDEIALIVRPRTPLGCRRNTTR